MTEICLLTIWMGELPDTFFLWKKTAHSNSSIDFYLITDQKTEQSAGNITVIYSDLPAVKKRLEKLLNMKITLEYPYKLCDYKPLWGMAFPEIVSKYAFWGHVDLDVILGDIRSFITEELLQNYDKLLEGGWLTLYRNRENVRLLFQKSMDKDNMAYPYKAAFRTKYACYFDEYMGMNILAWNYGYRVFRDQLTERYVQDFSWQKLPFQSYITKRYFLFEWKEGKLYRHFCDESGKILPEKPQEILIAHIQKRKMQVNFTVEEWQKKNAMWIIPNTFTLEKPEQELYTEQEKILYEEKIKQSDKKRSIGNLKKYGILNYIPHFIRSRRIRHWIVRKKGFF